MTIFVGYWLHVVHNWLYIAKYGAKSDYITHARYIKNKNVHSRGDGENCRQLSFFSPNDLVCTDCYWFDDISNSKADSAILPVDWWEYVGPQFSFSPGVSFQVWKIGINNIGPRIRSESNLIDADEKNPSTWSFKIVSYLCTGYGQISLQAAFQMGGESKVDKILMS